MWHVSAPHRPCIGHRTGYSLHENARISGLASADFEGIFAHSYKRWRPRLFFTRGSATASRVGHARTRRYLTGREVEKLMEAARKHGRYGHRDATMTLLAYRHGLRASELCDLQWHQVEINTGRLHVRRSKKGTPSVHPMQGDEIRALRRLQREQEASPYVFTSERGGPMSAKSFGTLFE